MKELSIRTLLVTALSAVAVVAVVAPLALGQQKVTGGSLTAADYIEIQQLVARYAYAVDTHADNGYAYAHLFAPDGVFGGASPTTGRDALAKLARSTQADRGGPSCETNWRRSAGSSPRAPSTPVTI